MNESAWQDILLPWREKNNESARVTKNPDSTVSINIANKMMKNKDVTVGDSLDTSFKTKQKQRKCCSVLYLVQNRYEVLLLEKVYAHESVGVWYE